jgi:hypothetical protein
LLTEEFSASSASMLQNRHRSVHHASTTIKVSGMRLIISAALLLASTAAMPALAQDNPQAHQGDGGRHDGDARGGGQHGDGQRGNGGGQPQARPAPQAGGNRGPQNGAQQAPGQGRPGQGRPGQDRPNQGGDAGRGPQGGRFEGGSDQGRHIAGRPDGGVQVWRDQNGRGPDGRGPDGRDRNGPNDQANRPAWANHPGAHGGEGGYRPNGDFDRGRPNGGGDWNRGWRQDQRYNWQGYRDSHRDAYRIGRYRPPSGYGWGYRRYGIGAALDAGFFSQDYWIGNPGYYRLPPAYGPYRWVRYYNDALLVNIYSGQILDEIPDFFY